jgi:hypothetical protein
LSGTINRGGYLAAVGIFLLGVSARSVFAQSLDDEAKGPAASTQTNSSYAGSEEVLPHGEEGGQAQYASALDGSGLISLDHDTPSHYIVGATFGGGWDSNPDNRGGSVASALYTVSAYIGIQANTARVRSLFQYQYTSTAFSADYAKQSRHVVSIGILGNVNERWSWGLRANGSYGQDAIRFLGTQQAIAVGDVPGVGSSSAAYVADAGTIADIEGDAEVKYRLTAVDSIGLSVSNAFSHYLGVDDSNKIATANFNYGKDLSPTLGVKIYAQNSSYYGTLHCESYGGGVGMTWRVSNGTAFAVSGGPQLNTSSCGSQQGFAYSVSFSTRLSLKSQIYVTSDRQATSSYLGPGLWQESSSGGYQRQVRLHGVASVDVGYVASDTLVEVSSYHGTFFDTAYNHTLAPGLRISSGYRAYVGDYGGTHFSRNAALFSLVWTPGAGHIFQ